MCSYCGHLRFDHKEGQGSCEARNCLNRYACQCPVFDYFPDAFQVFKEYITSKIRRGLL